jgi:hypothetical protein
MEETEIQRRDREQKEAARRRQEEERERQEAERAAHREALRLEAEARNGELELLMGELKDPEKRQIRLFSALLVYGMGWADGDKQRALDDNALRLARYTVMGQA